MYVCAIYSMNGNNYYFITYYKVYLKIQYISYIYTVISSIYIYYI